MKKRIWAMMVSLAMVFSLLGSVSVSASETGELSDETIVADVVSGKEAEIAADADSESVAESQVDEAKTEDNGSEIEDEASSEDLPEASTEDSEESTDSAESSASDVSVEEAEENTSDSSDEENGTDVSGETTEDVATDAAQTTEAAEAADNDVEEIVPVEEESEGSGEAKTQEGVTEKESVSTDTADTLDSYVNDSFYWARSISTNVYTSDYITGSGKQNYYKFTIPTTGTVSFAFYHRAVKDANWDILWRLYLYRSTNTYSSLLTRYFYDSESYTTTRTGMKLSAGTYYIKIDSGPRYYCTGTYNLMVKFQASASSTKKAQPLSVKYPSSIGVGETGKIVVSGYKGSLKFKPSSGAYASFKPSGKNTCIVKGLRPGPVKVTIEAAASGNYKKTTKTISFQIAAPSTTLSSVKNVATRSMQVKWKKKSGVSGYEVTWSTSKKFSGGWGGSRDIKGASKTSTKITGLQRGKTYYVRICTFVKVGSSNYYSKYSTVKSVKINK